jgi:hypothetical protein
MTRIPVRDSHTDARLVAADRPFRVVNREVLISTEELQYLDLMRAWGPGEIERFDIAKLNLMSAVELPGSEGLHVKALARQVDEWAEFVRAQTDRNYYHYARTPADYGHCEPYWRMLVLTSVLQQHYRVTYNREKVEHMDWADSRDLFLHGLLGPRRSGTCPSLPVLLVAVGRRLGYPLRLALAPGHLFSRWDDPHTGVRFNTEYHGHGLVVYPDEHYHHSPVEWTPQMHAEEGRLGPDRVFLRSLTPREELAFFLAQRGHMWESLGRWPEAAAVYNVAADLSPRNRAYAHYAGEAWRKTANPSYQTDERPRWKGVTANRSGPTTR